MAEVAAAVASGVWRPAIMTAEPAADSPPPVPLDEGVAAGLRTMMRAVVTQGTAAQAGLPPETFGKTGTAEVEGAEDHAWFIGYRGSWPSRCSSRTAAPAARWPRRSPRGS